MGVPKTTAKKNITPRFLSDERRLHFRGDHTLPEPYPVIDVARQRHHEKASGKSEVQRPWAFARSAIGKTPLTGCTPPVGKLPPPDQRAETRQFVTFSETTALPDRSDDPRRTPPQEADRPLSFHDATGETAGTWNYKYSNREMGEEPEPPDGIPSVPPH